ncbi:HNH endonuclease [Lactococcus lactis]|nr:HNH endonuclease [Lactococcus lactis]
MKVIPDYPGYGITDDGRVWSYKTNKFLRKTVINGYSGVAVTLEGVTTVKLVRRLVFEAFHGYVPDVIANIDGDRSNDHLNNLEGITWKELRKRNAAKISESMKKAMFKVEIATGNIELIEVDRNDKEYMNIHSAVTQHRITSKGYLYFYPEEKGELVEEIKSRITLSLLALDPSTISDDAFIFRHYIKNQVQKNKKYLKVLESVNVK